MKKFYPPTHMHREKELVTQVQTLNEVVCIHFALMHLQNQESPVSSGCGWIEQNAFFSLGKATSLGNGKFWIQTSFTQLKIDLVSYPTHDCGVGLIYTYDEGTETELLNW